MSDHQKDQKKPFQQKSALLSNHFSFNIFEPQGQSTLNDADHIDDADLNQTPHSENRSFFQNFDEQFQTPIRTQRVFVTISRKMNQKNFLIPHHNSYRIQVDISVQEKIQQEGDQRSHTLCQKVKVQVQQKSSAPSKSTKLSRKRDFDQHRKSQMQEDDLYDLSRKISMRNFYPTSNCSIEQFFEEVTTKTKRLDSLDQDDLLVSDLHRDLKNVEVINVSQPEEEVSLHIALLASQIIQIILKPGIEEQEKSQSQTDFPDPIPLRKAILTIIRDYPVEEKKSNSETNQKSEHSIKIAKKNLFNLFSEGVYVPVKYLESARFNGEQIQLSRLDLKKDQVQLFEENKILRSSFKKISFCPTYSVTSKIFYHICEVHSSELISDQQGIGKSHSLILFKLLSSKIFSFRWKYFNNKKISYEYEKRVNKIVSKIPKTVHINARTESSLEEMQLLMRSQCYQLAQKYKDYKWFYVDNKKKPIYLIYRHQFDINIRVIFDQVNHLASAKRKKNALNKLKDEVRFDQIHETVSDETRRKIQHIQQHKKSIEDQFKRANDYIVDYVRQIVCSFKTVKAFSSINIEAQTIPFLNLTFHHKRNPIKRVLLSFHLQVSTQKTKQDLIDFIIYNFQRKIMDHNHGKTVFPIMKIDDQNLQMTRVYLKELFEINTHVMILPIIVNRYFTAEKLLNPCIEMLSSLKSWSESYFIEKIKQFLDVKQLEMTSDERYSILMEIASKCKAAIQKSPEPFSRIDPKSIFFESKSIINRPETSFQSLIDMNMFRFNEARQKYECAINPLLLLSTLTEIERENGFFQKVLNSQHLLFKHFTSPDIIGRLFENMIIDILLTGGTCFSFKLSQKIYQNSEPIQSTIHLVNISNQPMSFFSLPKVNEKRKESYQFLESFQIILSQNQASLLQKPNVFLPLFHPTVQNLRLSIKFKDFSRKFHLINSKLIDVILTNYADNTLTVYAIDFTVGSKDQVLCKLKQFFSSFVELNDKYKTSIQAPKGKIIQVKLQYYVMTVLKTEIRWQQLIESQINEAIKKLKENQEIQDLMSIKVNQEENYCQIHRNDKPILLQKMGIILYNKCLITSKTFKDKISKKVSMIYKLSEKLTKIRQDKQDYLKFIEKNEEQN